MADAYLNVAERVLLAQRIPLRPAEILLAAHLEGLLPSDLHGATQHKTLHARLSEDISERREESRFFRTGAGIFFLRQFLNDDAIPSLYKKEYRAPPRRKELNRERVLSVTIGSLPDSPAPVPLEEITNVLSSGGYQYRAYRSYRENDAWAVVHSFVVVHRGHEVLSFRTGKFSPSTDPLQGRRSVGVGGAVLPHDDDLLYNSLRGVVGSGINELTYAVGLPRRLAERARYHNEVRPWMGVLSPGSLKHPPVMHVVMVYHCPDDFTPTKTALSTNELMWLPIGSRLNTVDDFDLTSRLLLSGEYLTLISLLSERDETAQTHQRR